MAQPAVVDTRNMLQPSAAREAGLVYTGMGRSLTVELRLEPWDGSGEPFP